MQYDELKALLVERGLPCEGTRDRLIERLHLDDNKTAAIAATAGRRDRIVRVSCGPNAEASVLCLFKSPDGSEFSGYVDINALQMRLHRQDAELRCYRRRYGEIEEREVEGLLEVDEDGPEDEGTEESGDAAQEEVEQSQVVQRQQVNGLDTGNLTLQGQQQAAQQQTAQVANGQLSPVSPYSPLSALVQELRDLVARGRASQQARRPADQRWEATLRERVRQRRAQEQPTRRNGWNSIPPRNGQQRQGRIAPTISRNQYSLPPSFPNQDLQFESANAGPQLDGSGHESWGQIGHEDFPMNGSHHGFTSPGSSGIQGAVNSHHNGFLVNGSHHDFSLSGLSGVQGPVDLRPIPQQQTQYGQGGVTNNVSMGNGVQSQYHIGYRLLQYIGERRQSSRSEPTPRSGDFFDLARSENRQRFGDQLYQFARLDEQQLPPPPLSTAPQGRTSAMASPTDASQQLLPGPLTWTQGSNGRENPTQ